MDSTTNAAETSGTTAMSLETTSTMNLSGTTVRRQGDKLLLCQRWNRAKCLMLLLLLSIPALMFVTAEAQLYMASLTGVVKDSSGAVVPAAQVTLTDIDEGLIYRTTSNSSGVYLLRNVPPGAYSLRVQAKGFKTTLREAVTLTVAQSGSIDLTLEVGVLNETVDVSSTAPLLNTQTATTGQSVDRRFMNDLPLVGRSSYDLVFLAPGVTQTAGSGVPTPTATGSVVGTNFISNGGRGVTSDVLLDGISTTVNDFEVKYPGYQPSVDAIQEFKVEQNNFSADVGYSGGTVVNVVMRSGTNQFHGTLYEFFRNAGLDANNWFNNANNIPIPSLHYNDFGGTLGGPIQKNKTFFFFDFEGSRVRSLATFAAGVPSATERNGDFGELCGGDGPNGPAAGATFNAQGLCSDPAGQIWDPYTGVFDPNQGGPVRQNYIPFNNLLAYQSPGSPVLNGTVLQPPPVPGNLIDPVAQKIMSYFPPPTSNVGAPNYNPYDNWSASSSNIIDTNQFDVRIDRLINNRTQLNGRYSHAWGLSTNPLCWNNALDPCSNGPNHPSQTNIALNLNRNISPLTVFSLSYGFVRSGGRDGGVGSLFPNFSPVTTLGMPAYMLASGTPVSPNIILGGGYVPAGPDNNIGQQEYTIGNFWRQTHDVIGSLNHTVGKHDFKFGGEFRASQSNTYLPGEPGGQFTFDQFGTSEFPGSGGGDALATFLTGTSTDNPNQYMVSMASAMTSRQAGGYALDNWRVNDKLSLNLGVRYDVEFPQTERFNRLNYFDPNVPSPLQVPGLPNLQGGDVFVTPSNRTQVPVYWREWQPRIGLVYRITPSTVLRAGYGIFYNMYAFAAGSVGFQPGEDGFQTITNGIPTYQNNLATPGATLSNPFPNGFLLLTGSSLGALTNVGFTVSGPIRAWITPPQTQSWSFGFEQQLPGQVVIDANYVGTKGTHLLYGGFNSLDFLGPWVEKLSPAQIANLESSVPNPFYGIVTNLSSGLSAPTVPAWQLQIPYPQFTGMNLYEPPWANSIYHALQVRAEKSFSHGLQFLMTYTWSKSIDDSSVVGDNWTYLGPPLHLQDPNNPSAERGLSTFDIPQTLQASYVYQLPFGRKRRWGAKWAGLLEGTLGGWQTNGILRFASGMPVFFSLTGGIPIPTYGQQPNLLAPLQQNHCSDSCLVNQYFANAQVAVVPAPFTLGNGPPVLPNVRAPGTRNASLSIFKEIPISRISEAAHLEMRLETFNAFNHPQLCAPQSTVNAPDFGVISCQANSPREVQLGAKLYF